MAKNAVPHRIPDHFESLARWLRDVQGINSRDIPPDQRSMWEELYEGARRAALAHDVTATLRAPPKPGHPRYAVAIEDGPDLWLTLWIQRHPAGDCVIIFPRGLGKFEPHTTYHANGRFHHKSDNVLVSRPQQRQPLTAFAGTEHLGTYGGHGTGMAICHPDAFTAALRVPAGVLNNLHGSVLVDLVEPGHPPAVHHREIPGRKIVAEQTFADAFPSIVIAVAIEVRDPVDP